MYNRRLLHHTSKIGSFANYIVIVVLLMTLSIHVLWKRDHLTAAYTVGNRANGEIQSTTDKKEYNARALEREREAESVPGDGLLSVESLRRPIQLVVVSSSPRSGSTFLGDLLSSPAIGLYLFEPLWYYSKTNRPILKNILDPDGDLLVEETLQKLLQCRLDELPDMFAAENKMVIWKKPQITAPLTTQQRTVMCRELKLRVIKTVRAKLSSVLPLLEVPELNMHIVHLVRDPRGIINSLGSFSGWRKTMTPEKTCLSQRRDLQSSIKYAGHPRLLRVRYEDLVADPEKESLRIFNWMGLKKPVEVDRFIEFHTQQAIPEPKSNVTTSENSAGASNSTALTDGDAGTNDGADDNGPSNVSSESPSESPDASDGTTPTPNKTSPAAKKLKTSTLSPMVFKNAYGTIRDATFDGLHWLKELDAESRKKTEAACKDVMLYLGYPLVYPQEKLLRTTEVPQDTEQ